MQELYLRLEQVETGEVRDPVAYVYRMAMNLAHDRRRARQRAQVRDNQWVESRVFRVGSEAIAADPPADAAYAAKKKLERIRELLNELSPECRRVFLLHKFEELPHTAIAELIGISRSTVEKHMTTAVKHLMRRLDHA